MDPSDREQLHCRVQDVQAEQGRDALPTFAIVWNNVLEFVLIRHKHAGNDPFQLKLVETRMMCGAHFSFS